MKTLKTENGIKIDVRSIQSFTDNAAIVEFGRDHYLSGYYIEDFRVDMDLDATLADGTSKSFKVSCQSADMMVDKLRAYSTTEMRFAQRYGVDWDESRELEEFVGHEDWEEIAKFLICIAEDKCKKWYDDNKDEATND